MHLKELSFATLLKTAPGTSVQDLGRMGQARYGIPVSGAMDERSMTWTNHLLKNPAGAAVLEISQPGFLIQFGAQTTISIAGAKSEIRLNGLEIPHPALVSIHPNDLLEIGAFRSGARVYLGIRHGFQTEEVLGSRSFYEGVTIEKSLRKGSTLAFFFQSERHQPVFAKVKENGAWLETKELTAYPGPDFGLLPEKTATELLSKTFTVSLLSNRMGIQLKELLENQLPELPTNPVYPGTVQLTSGGKLILLARDAQVTGGYPRILQLTPESESVLAQKRPGDSISFRLIHA